MPKLMTNTQYENYVFNINCILEVLNCTTSTIYTHYEDFPIDRNTLKRHLNVDKRRKNPSADYLEILFKFYNKHFEPKLSAWKVLGNTHLVDINLSLEQTDVLRYIGEYRLYYLSNHYEDEVHGGKMKVFSKNGGIFARMVIGIQDESQYENKNLMQAFSQSDGEKARAAFAQYRKELLTRKRKRCYFYEGNVSIINDLTVMIEFKGIEHHNTHRQTFLLNVKRKTPNKDGKPKTHKYIGGMALVLATPNEDHPQIRSYRAGISSVPLKLDDSRIVELLKLKVNEFGRITIAPEDDGKWYDLILDVEQKGT